jgi:hypothetical protein
MPKMPRRWAVHEPPLHGTVLRVLVALLVLGGSMAQTQQTPAPAARDGVITGQVVDASSGKPVAAAIVQINGAVFGGRSGLGPGAPPRIMTGGDGRFVFRNLPSGSFTFVATKGGYLDGRSVLGGPSQSVVLTAALRTAETSVRIWKAGAITGVVVDEAGEPVVGLGVTAVRRFTAGRRRFAFTGWSATTDDRGVYRLSGLPPGEYLVSASPPSSSTKISAFTGAGRPGRGSAEMDGIQVGDAMFMLGRGAAVPPPVVRGRMQIYPPIFYPSAPAPAQAITIPLTSGEERMGIDLQLQPVPAVRVTGTLMGASGPVGMATLGLMPAGAEDVFPTEALTLMSVSDAAGAFTFLAVPQGQYTLRASSHSTPGPRRDGDVYWLSMPLAVSGEDVDGVVALMRPALRITARLEFEGTTPRPIPHASLGNQFTPAPFALEPEDSLTGLTIGGLAGTTGAQGFTLAGFLPGKYRVRVQNSPPGWMFKSAMLNGVDVSETPFEFTRDVPDLVLTFTDRWSGMGGVVQGTGAGGAMVLMFTTNTQAWETTGTAPRRLRSTRANAKGEFGLSSVPPGDYYVIAVAEEQAPDWRDPQTLEALARQATQVSIGEGEHKMIDLRVKEVRQ